MITYKVFLDLRRPKPGNKYPLMFRVTYNRSSSNYASGIAVLKEHWNLEGSLITSRCPNYKELNQSLTAKFLAVQKAVLELENDNSFSFEAFKQKLHPKALEKYDSMSFPTYSIQVIADLHSVKRTGNAVVYQTAVNRLVKFVGHDKFEFGDVNYTLLDSFKTQLIKEGAKPNTIGNYFRSIRAIYNKAIKAKLVDRSLYPFTDISIKSVKTVKRAMSSDALTSLKDIVIKSNSPEQTAYNWFVLSFCLRGISFTDLAYLKKSDVVNGRVMYTRRKTHKAYSILLTSQALEIILACKHDTSYLLPVLNQNIEENGLEAMKVIQQWIKTTNKYLKRIGSIIGLENLTTYVSRHTWATTAKRLGYSNEIIAEALGHEYGNKITNIYLDSFDQSLIDQVNEKVIQCLLD